MRTHIHTHTDILNSVHVYICIYIHPYMNEEGYTHMYCEHGQRVHPMSAHTGNLQRHPVPGISTCIICIYVIHDFRIPDTT